MTRPAPAPLPFTAVGSKIIHGTATRVPEGAPTWTLCGRRPRVRDYREAGWEAIVHNRWTLLCKSCLRVSGSVLPPEARDSA